MEDRVLKNINDLADRRKIDQILKEAILEIRPNKKSVWQYITAIILSLISSLLIGFIYNTVSVMTEVSEILFNTSIAIIGIILGAYAIFQALLQKELIITLAKTDNNLLKVSNRSFLNIVILNAINAIVSFFIRIILSGLDDSVLAFRSILTNNISASLLIFIFLAFNFFLLSEIIVFTVNLYRMFCVHNALIAIAAVKEDEDKGMV